MAAAGTLRALLASKDRSARARPQMYAEQCLEGGGLSLVMSLARETRPEHRGPAAVQAAFLLKCMVAAEGPAWCHAAVTACAAVACAVEWLVRAGVPIEARAEAASCLRVLSLTPECKDAIEAAGGPAALQQVGQTNQFITTRERVYSIFQGWHICWVAKRKSKNTVEIR